MARPTKIAPVIQALKEILSNEDNSLGNAFICTDSELLELINERLPESDRICGSTFEKWKAGKSNDPLGDEFLRLLKKALIEEKRNILFRLTTDDKAWQRWAWLMERKFDEWNLRSKQELSVQADPMERVRQHLPDLLEDDE